MEDKGPLGAQTHNHVQAMVKYITWSCVLLHFILLKCQNSLHVLFWHLFRDVCRFWHLFIETILFVVWYVVWDKVQFIGEIDEKQHERWDDDDENNSFWNGFVLRNMKGQTFIKC